MYTSCGWFFDELSGLETAQVMQYAGRAIRLAQDFGADGIEAEFLDRLAAAKSNLPEHHDGKVIYEKWVKPAAVSTEQLAGHYAISSLFEPFGEHTKIFCYNVRREDHAVEVEGKHKLAVGRARFSSEITAESATLGFAVLHLGDHNIAGGVRHFEKTEDYDQLKAALIDSFSKADTTLVMQALAERFSNKTFSLRTLFRDEQRKIVDLILKESLASAEGAYRGIYENQAPLIRFLNGLGIPVPAAFHSAAEIALNSQLKHAFEQRDPDVEAIQSSLKEAAATNVALDVPGLEFAFRKRLETEATFFASKATNLEMAQKLATLLKFASTLPFPVVLWEVQNICYRPLIKTMEELREQAQTENAESKQLFDALTQLRENLRINGQ
jgi:hypothetical protein